MILRDLFIIRKNLYFFKAEQHLGQTEIMYLNMYKNCDHTW